MTPKSQAKTRPNITPKITTQIQNYKKLCAEAQQEGKTVISISLSSKTADYLKEKPNVSAFIQRLVEKERSEENKDEENILMKKLGDIMVKYGFSKPPDFEEMKTYTAWINEEGDSNHFKERNPAPECYLFNILMLPIQEEGHIDLTKEEKQVLKEARKIPLERRTQILTEAINDALKRTEIREGLSLIQFIADTLVDFSKQHDTERVEKISIRELAEKSGLPYQQFYMKILPKIRQVCDWNDAWVEIG